MSQLRTIQFIFNTKLLPLALRSTVLKNGDLCSNNPTWHIAHSIWEAHEALILPYEPTNKIALRFTDSFDIASLNSRWGVKNVGADSIKLWGEDTLIEIDKIHASKHLHNQLPCNVKFPDYQICTLDEALDYVVFHTSFHAGIAHQLLKKQ